MSSVTCWLRFLIIWYQNVGENPECVYNKSNRVNTDMHMNADREILIQKTVLESQALL